MQSSTETKGQILWGIFTGSIPLLPYRTCRNWDSAISGVLQAGLLLSKIRQALLENCGKCQREKIPLQDTGKSQVFTQRRLLKRIPTDFRRYLSSSLKRLSAGRCLAIIQPQGLSSLKNWGRSTKIQETPLSIRRRTAYFRLQQMWM